MNPSANTGTTSISVSTHTLNIAVMRAFIAYTPC